MRQKTLMMQKRRTRTSKWIHSALRNLRKAQISRIRTREPRRLGRSYSARIGRARMSGRITRQAASRSRRR